MATCRACASQPVRYYSRKHGALARAGRLAHPTQGQAVPFMTASYGHAPRVVAIGGGTGLPVLMRGLKRYTPHITAIVTSADDGGSSGRLRQDFGILPPGDFRNNIAALSESEEIFQLLMQYRFGRREGLGGHAFGNLLITALASIYGSFETGMLNACRVLAVKGQVLPSTLETVTLCAEMTDPQGADAASRILLRGESKIGAAQARIHRVMLDPSTAKAFPGAIQAILQADLIIAGPGSFYTSTLPNLLVQDVRAAVNTAQAPKIFVANILNQQGEASGYALQDYLAGLDRHQVLGFDHVIVNNRILESGNWKRLEWIRLNGQPDATRWRIFAADLIDAEVPWRHDSRKLARLIMNVYQEVRPPRGGRNGLGAPRNADRAP